MARIRQRTSGGISSSQGNTLYIRLDGTSTTSAIIPLALGAFVPSETVFGVGNTSASPEYTFGISANVASIGGSAQHGYNLKIFAQDSDGVVDGGSIFIYGGDTLGGDVNYGTVWIGKTTFTLPALIASQNNLYVGGVIVGNSSAYFNSSVMVGGLVAPLFTISVDGQANKTIGMNRITTASAGGKVLTIQSGGAVVGGTDVAGGNLILSSGTSTGRANSLLLGQVFAGSTTGTGDNTTQTVFTFGYGNQGNVRGGASGTLNFQGGTGGSSTGIGGAGGIVTATGGVGGSTGTGGAGGTISIAGGAANTTKSGGAAGNLTTTGGAATSTGGGGAGGGFSAAGGAASAGSGNAGNGGSVTLSGGGSPTTSGAGANAGSITSSGGAGGTTGTGGAGGSLSMSGSAASGATAGAAGGSITTSANGARAGGAIDTSAGGTAAGGAITTSNGGGSIDTTGTGSIQLGVAATRTTLNGSGTAARTATLQDVTHTIVGRTDVVALTGLVADINATNFANSGAAGQYRVNYVLADTTADITAGAVVLTISWTDVVGATNTTATQLLTGVGRVSGTVYLQQASGNVNYTITHTGAYGTAVYALYLTCERLS